jgi:hypothetical protein
MSATDISERDVVISRQELALPQANSPGFRFLVFTTTSELEEATRPRNMPLVRLIC